MLFNIKYNEVTWLMDASKLLGYVVLHALGLTLILEGIFLNVIGILFNDGLYVIEGAVLIFLGALGMSIGNLLFKQLREAK